MSKLKGFEILLIVDTVILVLVCIFILYAMITPAESELPAVKEFVNAQNKQNREYVDKVSKSDMDYVDQSIADLYKKLSK